MKQVQVELDEVFCNAVMSRLTEAQQRNYVLPGGGNTPILLLGSNCGVTSCSNSMPNSLSSLGFLLREDDVLEKATRYILFIHLFSQISIIPNV